MKDKNGINRILLAAGLLILTVMMSSCSLAAADAGTEGGSDRLIGAFITSEYLDLFDMDAWLNDNASALGKNTNLQITDTSGYEQKLYAEIDKNNSEDPFDWSVSFPGIEGINFFVPVWTNENGEQYWDGICGEGICDTNINVGSSDTGDTISLSGTIYILPGMADEDISYYLNPVYQTESGEIYAIGNSGFSTSVDSSEGVQLTTTINDEVKITENNVTNIEKCNVEVSIAVMHRPVNITVWQMDSDHQVVKKTEYKPEEVPEELQTEPGTAYMLIETQKENLSGEKSVTRELYEYSEEEETFMRTFHATEDGLLVMQDTAVIWTK